MEKLEANRDGYGMDMAFVPVKNRSTHQTEYFLNSITYG